MQLQGTKATEKSYQNKILSLQNNEQRLNAEISILLEERNTFEQTLKELQTKISEQNIFVTTKNMQNERQSQEF